MAVLETKAKEILIAVWRDGASSYPSFGSAIDYVIADTLSVAQDNVKERTFKFATSHDETLYSASEYKIALNNAAVSETFMTEIMGWEKTTDPEGVVAPEYYESKYAALQVKIADDKYYFIPKISIAPKLVMESIKSNLVYGNIYGTATNAYIGDKQTVFCKATQPFLVKPTPSHGPSHGSYLSWEDGSTILWEDGYEMLLE